jgi:hypothetical protein
VSEPRLPFTREIVATLRAHPTALAGIGLYVGCGNGRNYLPLVDAGLTPTGLTSPGKRSISSPHADQSWRPPRVRRLSRSRARGDVRLPRRHSGVSARHRRRRGGLFRRDGGGATGLAGSRSATTKGPRPGSRSTSTGAASWTTSRPAGFDCWRRRAKTSPVGRRLEREAGSSGSPSGRSDERLALRPRRPGATSVCRARASPETAWSSEGRSSRSVPDGPSR